MLVDFTRVKNIFIVCGKTDMRKSIDGLASIIQYEYNLDCKRPITRYIENLQSHSTLEIPFFIYNLLVQFPTIANKLLELLFLRKTPHWVTSPKDR